MTAALFLFLATAGYGIYRLGCAVHNWAERRDGARTDGGVR